MKPLIVVVSNRGPFSFKKSAGGSFRVERGTGGLVTALGALAEQHDVLWVAAAMDKDDRSWVQAQPDGPQQVEGISLQLIEPNKKAYQGYYNVISNPLLWFIQHQLWDTPRNPSITQETWDAWGSGYLPINKAFAQVVADMLEGEKRPVIVLPQDYQLYLFPHYLRELLGKKFKSSRLSIFPGQGRMPGAFYRPKCARPF